MHLLNPDFTKDRLRGADLANGSAVPQIFADGRLPPPSMDNLDELEAQSI